MRLEPLEHKHFKITPVTEYNKHDFLLLLPKFFDELGVDGRDDVVSALPTFNSFIAYDSNIPVGIASVSALDNVLLGQILWVSPEYRSTNIGGLLYRKLCQINRKAVKKIVVKPERVELYKKLGYTVEYLVLRKE